MTEEISIIIPVDIPLDHPQSAQKKSKSQSIPVDSPTATLSCFSDCDMNEDDDRNEDHENLVSHVLDNELDASYDSALSELDQSAMGKMKQEMQNWQRERQELLKLRQVVRKQHEEQEELRAKLEAYQRHPLGDNEAVSRDPNGQHAQSLGVDLDYIIRRNLNCFPEDEVAFQLEEVQLQLEASQKQVKGLQDELIESQRMNKESLLAQKMLQEQLRAAQGQLESERRKREDAMSVHKLQLELQQMRAKEDQEELHSQIDFWRDQFQMVQKHGQGVPLETVQEGRQWPEDNLKDEEGTDSPQKGDAPGPRFDPEPEEEQEQLNCDLSQGGIFSEMTEEEDKQSNEDDESRRSGSPNQQNDTIDSLQKKLSKIKKKYGESKDQLTYLESMVHEMSEYQQTMVQKIRGAVQLLQTTQRENEKLKKEKASLVHKMKRDGDKMKKEMLNLEVQGVVRLLQQTKEENEKLKKENLTLLHKAKRENDKLKMEKLSLEKQRREKLTIMTRNAHR